MQSSSDVLKPDAKGIPPGGILQPLPCLAQLMGDPLISRPGDNRMSFLVRVKVIAKVPSKIHWRGVSNNLEVIVYALVRCSYNLSALICVTSFLATFLRVVMVNGTIPQTKPIHSIWRAVVHIAKET